MKIMRIPQYPHGRTIEHATSLGDCCEASCSETTCNCLEAVRWLEDKCRRADLSTKPAKEILFIVE